MGHPTGSERDRLLGSEATVLRLLGLWRPDAHSGVLASRLLASVSLASVAFVPAGAVLKLCLDTPEELDELAVCLYLVIICSLALFMGAVFFADGPTARELLQLLRNVRNRFGNDERSDYIRRKHKRIVDRLYIYFQVMMTLPLLYWLCPPGMLDTAQPGGQDAEETVRLLPLPFVYPAGGFSSPTHELIYVVQIFCLTVVGQATICLDVLFARLMTLVAAELEVVNENMSAIENVTRNYRASEKELGSLGHEEILPVSLVKGKCLKQAAKYQNNDPDDALSQLVRNIHHHQEILRCGVVLQSIMEVSIFVVLTVNMANLCSNMFVFISLLNEEGGNMAKAVKGLSTVPALFLQSAIYCLFGQITTDQSERLLQSAYACGWTNGGPRLKRSLLIFMLVVGKPLEITVGKTCKLSKEMLLQILNGTYVLLNMLLQLRSSD